MTRRAEIVVRVEGGRLVPAAGWDRDSIAALPEGALLSVTKYRPRTDKARRFLHAVMRLASDNAWDDRWTPERIKVTVKARGGWVKGMRVEVDGSSLVEFRSVADLDADEMTRFIEQTLHLITTEICPGMDVDDLRREADSAVMPTAR